MTHSKFQVPDRCDLAQLAHWFVDRVQPISPELYPAAPLEFDIKSNDLRNLDIELLKGEYDPRGTLIDDTIFGSDKVEFWDGEKTVTDLEFKSWCILQNDFRFDFNAFTLSDIDFSQSRIFAEDGLGSLTLESDEVWKIHIMTHEEESSERNRMLEYFERAEEDYVRFICNVTVDFSKFRSAITGLPLEKKKHQTLKAGPGRPAKYNWDIIWAEIAVRADLDGLPEKQEDFIRLIQDWYEQRFSEEPPSRETLKPKLSKVYRHHRKSKPDN